MLEEFRKFVARGSFFDLAVGIVIGAAFSTVVNSLVKDLIMPPIGLLTSGVDFSSSTSTSRAGSTLRCRRRRRPARRRSTTGFSSTT